MGSGGQSAIQSAVLDGFGDVVAMDVFFVCEIGDGSGDFEDAIEGASAHAELLGGAFEKADGVLLDRAVLTEFFGLHLAVDLVGGVGEAFGLALAGCDHTGADGGRAFPEAIFAQILEGDGGDFDVQVDAIEQWAGYAALIAVDIKLTTAAVVAVMTAGTGIHGRNEQKITWVAQR